MTEKPIIVFESQRKWWQLIIAAVCFSLAFLWILQLLFLCTELYKEFAYEFKRTTIAVAVLLSTGIPYGVVKGIMIDPGRNKYAMVYSFGAVKFKFWKTMPVIDYVSVFSQPKANGRYYYEVNLWYGKNKHLCVYENEVSWEEAYDFGVNVASALNLRLWNALIPGEGKWEDPINEKTVVS